MNPKSQSKPGNRGIPRILGFIADPLFRGQMIKKWCRDKQKFGTAPFIFDVPDGMHILGVYDTSVSTKTYSSVKEYITQQADKANTHQGDSSFKGRGGFFVGFPIS